MNGYTILIPSLDLQPGRATLSITEHRSPVRLLTILLAAIFTADFFIMLLIERLGIREVHVAGIVDALLLSALVFPCLYHFSFKQLIAKNRSLADSELRLERRVQSRTRELEQEIERSNRRECVLKILHRLSHTLTACRTESDLAKTVESHVMQLFPNSVVSLSLSGEDDCGDNVEDEAEDQSCIAQIEGVAPLQPNGCPQDAPSEITHPLISNGARLGSIHLHLAGETGEDHRRLLTTVSESAAISLANIRLRLKLRAQAIRDPLTNLFNRRYLEDELEHQLAGLSSETLPVSIFLLDIDHFKKFNDKYGHEAGDEVLKELARLMAAWAREEDTVARFGGEEFVAILPSTDQKTALRRAEELCRAVRSHRFVYNDLGLDRVTVSIGIASATDSKAPPQDILQSADLAMYESKRAGRDRATMA